MEISAGKMNTAKTILEELNLLAHLKSFGEAEVVGSVALDLIVKPDLDFHLLINDEDLFATTLTIMEYLLDKPKIKEVRLTDWREVNGLKIGVDSYPTESEDWSIDIWITNDRKTTAFDYVKKVNSLLSKNQRQTILQLKTHFYHQGLLRDGLSLKIYNAVLESNVKSVSEFLKVAKVQIE